MIGISRTKDVVMRSRRITGKEAHAWGIVTELVPDEDLERATTTLANELCQFAPLAQRTAKRLLNDTEATAQHTQKMDHRMPTGSPYLAKQKGLYRS